VTTPFIPCVVPTWALIRTGDGYVQLPVVAWFADGRPCTAGEFRLCPLSRDNPSFLGLTHTEFDEERLTAVCRSVEAERGEVSKGE
jgi:hypothetical protein